MEKKKLEFDLQTSLCDHNHLTWWRGPLLGKGACGSVYMAIYEKSCSHDYHLSPIVAVKSAEAENSVKALMRENHFLCKLQKSTHIIRCLGEDYTWCESGKNLVYNLFMEYASGGSLANLVDTKIFIGLPESTVKHYTRSILKGLVHIHENGLVHCDLKTENILLVPQATGDFEAKIADFGLAKRIDEKFDRYRGTALYMAPEALLLNIQEQSSDIWSLGCVVVEMISGQLPWKMNNGCRVDEIVHRIQYNNETPYIPNDNISAEAADFLKICLAMRAADRLTAKQLLNHPFVVDD